MKLEECYALFGGNYEDVQARLRSDVLIKKFVLKFLSDPTFASLCASLDSKNYEEAFRFQQFWPVFFHVQPDTRQMFL